MMIFFITLLLVGLAVVGLGVSIFFTKKGTFPETHVGSNKAMRERGIRCVFAADREERERARGTARVPNSAHSPKKTLLPGEGGEDAGEE
ncbi:MAG: hypothetical protein LBD64_04375 [Odoribacteraceae bacterium]|jgi:hypothetical protein|nr:hypothetical protein [Odoribacteraceae bacterium]